MNDPGFKPRALGEVAIRCRDYPAMRQFYQNVLHLDPVQPGARGGYRDGITFFRLGESFGGHVAVLALFEAEDGSGSTVNTGTASSLHHIALSLPWDEQDAAKAWLEDQGYPAKFQDFEWAGWRGLFTQDPDGNTLELVAASAEWHI